MTRNRNLKRRVRARAARTGESYAAARRHVAGPQTTTVRVAAAQVVLHPDPGDAQLLRAAGDAVRAVMRQARAEGARLVHFPEGALTSPHKRIVSSSGPDAVGAADWDRADWAALRSELLATARLAGELGIWTVVGSIHRRAGAVRATNCLHVLSDSGRVTARYDERMLSRTKATHMYAPGAGPLVFAVDGVRFGCAVGTEARYPEIFAAYEAEEVDCVLFSTAGDPSSPAVLSRAAAGHAAATSTWISYAGPVGEGEPSAGVLAPDGSWAATVASAAGGFAVAEVAAVGDLPARVWRRAARATSAAAQSPDAPRP